MIDEIELQNWGGSGRVVKLLTCGARGSNPSLDTSNSEIWYRLLPSRDMTDIFLKRRKFFKITHANKRQNLYTRYTMYLIMALSP